MKRILYLGLDPDRYQTDGELVHCPLIRIVPRPLEDVKEAFYQLGSCSHVLFTSRQAAMITLNQIRQMQMPFEQMQKKTYLAVGKATASILTEHGLPQPIIADEACGEGVVALLTRLNLKNAYLFFPYSSLARSLVRDCLQSLQIPHIAFPLYDTKLLSVALPELDAFDEIVFTSPSTVAAFARASLQLPPYAKCVSIGPVTQKALNDLYKRGV